jgi:hypothetical protein
MILGKDDIQPVLELVLFLAGAADCDRAAVPQRLRTNARRRAVCLVMENLLERARAEILDFTRNGVRRTKRENVIRTVGSALDAQQHRVNPSDPWLRLAFEAPGLG